MSENHGKRDDSCVSNSSSTACWACTQVSCLFFFCGPNFCILVNSPLFRHYVWGKSSMKWYRPPHACRSVCLLLPYYTTKQLNFRSHLHSHSNSHVHSHSSLMASKLSCTYTDIIHPCIHTSMHPYIHQICITMAYIIHLSHHNVWMHAYAHTSIQRSPFRMRGLMTLPTHTPQHNRQHTHARVKAWSPPSRQFRRAHKHPHIHTNAAVYMCLHIHIYTSHTTNTHTRAPGAHITHSYTWKYYILILTL